MENNLSDFKRWLENHSKGYSSNSIQAYIADLTVFQRYLNKKGLEFSGQGLQKKYEGFISDEIESDKNYTTLRRRIASLSRFVDFLETKQRIDPVNFKYLVEMIRDLHKEKSFEEVLSDDDVKKIMMYLSDDANGFHKRDESIFRLLLETGSSIQRILNVELDDLNFETNQLKLTNDMDETFTLKLDNVTSECIQTYIAEARANVASSNELSALFISQQGRRISRQAVWQNLKKLGKLTGLDSKLNARIIKNTAVKRILKLELPVEQVRLTLGHINALSTYALIRKTRKFSEEQ